MRLFAAIAAALLLAGCSEGEAAAPAPAPVTVTSTVTVTPPAPDTKACRTALMNDYSTGWDGEYPPSVSAPVCSGFTRDELAKLMKEANEDGLYGVAPGS
ncbi:MAG TPA: hypothetical protein VIQ30_22490 [Pseudonocardia sp.]